MCVESEPDDGCDGVDAVHDDVVESENEKETTEVRAPIERALWRFRGSAGRPQRIKSTPTFRASALTSRGWRTLSGSHRI